MILGLRCGQEQTSSPADIPCRVAIDIMDSITSAHISALLGKHDVQMEEEQCGISTNQMNSYQTSSHTTEADASSRPPSPPSTGQNTPTLRIAPCPDRLLPIYPPFNYGTVELKTIFRSSYPLERNIDFIMRLKIKTLLCLVDTDPCEQYKNWVSAMDVKRLRVDIAANKDGIVNTTTESLYEAILYVMTKANHPIYVHCNQGKHRTGCVMACMRKVQGTSTTEEIIDEYVVYAGKKARTGDIDLIRAFDTKEFAKFVTACNHVIEPYSGFYVRRRIDSGTFIHELESISDTDVDLDTLLITTTQVSDCSDEDALLQKVKSDAGTFAVSQEAVDRVRLIMGEDIDR